MRSVTEIAKNSEEDMRDSNSLKSAYNNALLGLTQLSKPTAIPLVLTLLYFLFDKLFTTPF
jgi:hypothetical protein